MILKNVHIVNANSYVWGWLEINEQGIISQINAGECFLPNAIDLNNNYLLPGFIDSHSHGGYGLSFNETNFEKFQNLFYQYQKAIVQEGIVAIVPSTVTCSQTDLNHFAKRYSQLINQSKSEVPVLAWYIEGPFISVEKKGAHEAKLIKSLDETFLTNLTNQFRPQQVIITIAPENNDLDLIAKFSDRIIFSIGHSNDRVLTTNLLAQKQIKRITHLFNAMTTLDHRSDSIANAIFDHKKWASDFCIELITDQIHVRPELVRLTFKSLPIENLALISDALPDKGLANGDYFLNNLPIVKKDDVFYLKDCSSLAGSAMTYNKIITNFCAMYQPSWQDLVYVTSLNVAKNLKLEHDYGAIKVGMTARLVVLDAKKDLLQTIIKNQIVYQKK